MLALVTGQDVEPAEGSDGTDGRWRIARKVAEDRVISKSTPKPDTPVSHRRPAATGIGHMWPPNPTGIITDAALTKAAGTENSDPAVAEQFLAADVDAAAGATGVREWYGDSAYGTGDLRGAIHDAGHAAVIKPRPIPAAVIQGGFTVDDFTVDEAAATATCPAGDARPVAKTRSVVFGALCRDCRLAAHCTTSKTGRTIKLHERDDLLRQARGDWTAAPDVQEKYRQNRPNVERVISQIASRGGRRLELRTAAPSRTMRG